MSAGSAALVRVAWTPGRAEPSHRSELVTQWLCGERLTLEEEGEDGWLGVTGPDGYGCWVDAGALAVTEPGEADRWEEQADRISLGTELRSADGATVPRFLPWGARVAAADGEGLRLPDGARAEPADPDRLVAREECVLRFPPRADALLGTAAGWIGAPYLWGGRIPEGVDCSGYAQAVFRFHGRELPRDSDLQMRADEPAWEAAAGRAGPGPAGRASTSGSRGAGVAAGGALSAAREFLRPGDLLFFGENTEAITHVAICAEPPEILHAAAGRGQVVRDDLAADDPLMERLRGRLLAVTRPLDRGAGDGAGAAGDVE